MDGTNDMNWNRHIERFDGNAEEKRAHGRLKCRWEDNIKIHL